jgi:hypothetical protein
VKRQRADAILDRGRTGPVLLLSRFGLLFRFDGLDDSQVVTFRCAADYEEEVWEPSVQNWQRRLNWMPCAPRQWLSPAEKPGHGHDIAD